MAETVKLQKYISDNGIMSRRAAESKILDGSIKVNGEPVELGRRITPGVDTVTYLGVVVGASHVKNVYIALNKPKGYVTTMKDECDRKCVADLVSDVGARVYPCGRLDYDSEGLILLTNDGALANKLMHPVHHIPKYYTVSVKGKITEKQLKKLNSEMTIDGYKIIPAEVGILKMTENETVLSFTLFEGRNRQIRKMCEIAEIGYITKLKRIAIGEIELGNIKPGEWRKLSFGEVQYLKNYK